MSSGELKTPIIVLASVVVIGALGFSLIEGESLLNSLYWTFATITTVGYGDIPIDTAAGRVFAISVMITGVVAILYSFTLIGRNIIEGRIWEFLTMKEKERLIEDMENHLIVCGYGDVGRAVTEQLLLAGEDVVVVDKDGEVLRVKAKDTPYIVGDATSEEKLEQAGIERAKGIFATLPEDSDNILLSLGAKECNPDIRIVARSNNREVDKHLRRAGAEAVIHPGSEGGIRMARAFIHPEITNLYDHLLSGGVGKADVFEISEGGMLDGTTIKESGLRKEVGVSVVALKRNGEIIVNPEIDKEIRARDTLIVMGTSGQIRKMREKFG